MKVRFIIKQKYYNNFKDFMRKENLKELNHLSICNTHLIDIIIDGRKKKKYNKLFIIEK